MQTLKKNLIISTLAALGLITSSLGYSQEIRGGNSAGGSGSNLVDNHPVNYSGNFGSGPAHSFTPSGFGLLLMNSKGLSIRERLLKQITEQKIAVTFCQSGEAKDEAIVPLPEEYQQFFALQMEPEQNWLGQFFSPNPKLLPVTSETICASEGSYLAYANFVFTLWDLKSFAANDGSHRYLFSKTVHLGGPIRLVLTSRRKQLLAVGGTIEESAWHEPTNDKIYFGKQNVCHAFNCFGHRGETNVLVHEVAHSFLLRVLKDKYPRAEHWHDIRHMGQKGKDDGLGKLLNSQTTPLVSLIEALANVFEKRHYLHNHPFIERDMSAQGLQENNCYTPMALAAAKIFSTTPFTALEDNEVYVGSVLNTFLSQPTSSSDLKKDKLDPAQIYIQESVSVKRQRELIDAIASYKPTTLTQLAQAFDKISEGDWGWRMLREYFYQDYRTNEKLGSEFRKIAEEKRDFRIVGVDWSDFRYCGPEDIYAKSLTAVLKNERAKAIQDAKSFHATLISSSGLEADIEKELNLTIVHVDETQARSMPVQEFADKHAYLISAGICRALYEERSAEEQAAGQPVENKIYQRIEKMGHLTVIAEIYSTFSAQCRSQASDADVMPLEVLTRLNELASQAKVLQANSVPESNREMHFKRVQDWLEIKGSLIKGRNKFRDQLYTVKAALE